MPDAGVGQQPLDVALHEGHEVAQHHGQRCQDGHDDLQVAGRGHKRVDEEPDHQREGRGLRPHRQVRRDGHRRALVGVGSPHVERHRGDLERQPRYEKREPDLHAEPGVGHLRQERPDLLEAGRAQQPVYLADAVQHQGGRERPQQDVLGPGLVGFGVVAVERDEHVEAEAQQLQRNVRRQQLAGRYHQHHGEHGEQQDAVVLARVLQVPLHVLHAGQHDDDPERREEDLEDQRVPVEDQRAAVQAELVRDQLLVEGAGLAPRGRQQDRADPGQPHDGNSREDLLAPVRQEQI